MAARKWTEEQRKAQAQKILNWKPWLKSTGPKTVLGKSKSSTNAKRHGVSKFITYAAGVLRDLEDKFN